MYACSRFNKSPGNIFKIVSYKQWYYETHLSWTWHLSSCTTKRECLSCCGTSEPFRTWTLNVVKDKPISSVYLCSQPYSLLIIPGRVMVIKTRRHVFYYRVSSEAIVSLHSPCWIPKLDKRRLWINIIETPHSLSALGSSSGWLGLPVILFCKIRILLDVWRIGGITSQSREVATWIGRN